MRIAQAILQGLRTGLIILACAVMGGLFIGVSGFASVSFAYEAGKPSGNELIYVGVALAAELYADLAAPLFWRHLRIAGRTLLLAFFVVCLAYKLTAANRFAAETLGKRETAAATATTDYDLAKDKVELLRKTITDNIDARSVTVIEAEIDKLLLDTRAEGCTGPINGKVTGDVCPKVAVLRTELARAKVRDQAQTDLVPAIADLRTKATVAIPVAKDDTGVIGQLLALAGVHVGGWSDLVAHLFMVLIEGGAIAVPMLIGLAYGEGRRPAVTREDSAETIGARAAAGDPGEAGAAPASRAAEVEADTQVVGRLTLRLPRAEPLPGEAGPPSGDLPEAMAALPEAESGGFPETLAPAADDAGEGEETKASKASPRRVTDRAKRDLADLTAFLEAETERSAGDQVQATAFYFRYCTWKQGRGEQPITLAQFGTVLTRDLGLSKDKVDGKMQYANLRLKAPSEPASLFAEGQIASEQAQGGEASKSKAA